MANSFWAEFAERHHAAAAAQAEEDTARKKEEMKQSGKSLGQAAGSAAKTYQGQQDANQMDRQLGRASNY